MPVPRPQSTVSAKDFFVYALTFGALIFLAIHMVVLLNALIDLAWNDEPRRYRNTIRWSISVIIVALPTYLWLTLRDRKAVVADPALYRSFIRKWLIYIALLVASAVLLGDLVYVIYSFLEGNFTLQFLAKAAVVAAVSGGIFLFYLSDTRKGDAA